MIAAMPKGADSPAVQAIIQRWRDHMDYFWTPSLDQLLGLAEGYKADPRLKNNFDKMHPQLAEFMREAVGVLWGGGKVGRERKEERRKKKEKPSLGGFSFWTLI